MPCWNGRARSNGTPEVPTFGNCRAALRSSISAITPNPTPWKAAKANLGLGVDPDPTASGALPLTGHTQMKYDIFYAAWLAGFVDGEGHFGIVKSGTTLTWRLTVTQADHAILCEICDRFGGSIYKVKPPKGCHSGRQVWRWVARPMIAVGVIAAVLPFLRRKKEQACLVMAFHKTMSASRTPVSNEVAVLRREIYDQMIALNGNRSSGTPKVVTAAAASEADIDAYALRAHGAAFP